LISSLGAGDYRAATDAAEILAGSKDDSLRFLEWIESWFRDLLVYGVTQNQQTVVNSDMLTQIQRQSASTNVERLFCWINETKAAIAGLQRNLNRRMVIEGLLLNTVEAN
jgi:DNA polymerase III gamma/tau subunit